MLEILGPATNPLVCVKGRATAQAPPHLSCPGGLVARLGW